MADVLAYVTFQSPVYVAILWSVGADWHQIIRSNLAVSMMGAAYGYFLDLLPPPVRVAPIWPGEGLTNAWQRLALPVPARLADHACLSAY